MSSIYFPATQSDLVPGAHVYVRWFRQRRNGLLSRTPQYRMAEVVSNPSPWGRDMVRVELLDICYKYDAAIREIFVTKSGM